MKLKTFETLTEEEVFEMNMAYIFGAINEIKTDKDGEYYKTNALLNLQALEEYEKQRRCKDE